MFITILLFYSVRPHGDTESLNAFVLWWKTKRIRKTYKYSRCGRPENASSLTVVRELEFKSLWGRIKRTLMDACCLHDPPFCVWQMPTDMMVIVKVTLGQNWAIKDPFFIHHSTKLQCSQPHRGANCRDVYLYVKDNQLQKKNTCGAALLPQDVFSWAPSGCMCVNVYAAPQFLLTTFETIFTSCLSSLCNTHWSAITL